MVKAPLSNLTTQWVAIAFVDDTSFYFNRAQVQHKIQSSIKIYTVLYETTGDLIEEEKSHYYAWQWVKKGDKLIIKDIELEIIIHNHKLKQLTSDQIIRALGIHMNPKLDWNEQILKMKQKLTESVTKLISTNINSFQTHLYFNMYMTRAVFLEEALLIYQQNMKRN